MTEITMASEALRQTEERFQLMIDAVVDYAIFMLDPSGVVVSWNAGAERIKGYTAAEIVGQHFSVFYGEEDRARHHPEEELRRALADGSYEEEGWRVRKDGSRLWASVVITAVHDSTGELRGFAKVTRDLTERRRNEQAAREAEAIAAVERMRTAQAELAVRQRDEFMSIAAHELRTPLAALKLKLQGTQRAIAKTSTTEGIAERLHSAERQVERLTGLIERLLDVSRVVEGRLQIHREAMDLAAVVREIVGDYREPASAAGCELRIIAPAAVAGAWDRQRLEQVVINMLTNAIKYGAGRPIDVVVEANGSEVSVAVTDRGIGIAAADAERIFGRFERAVPIANYGGLGLGLYIARHIAEAHDGALSVESELGRGSTFLLALPIDQGR